MAPMSACTFAVLVLSTLTGIVACGDNVRIVYDSTSFHDAPFAQDSVITQPVYLVEGDILLNESQLMAYYGEHDTDAIEKSSVAQVNGSSDTIFSSSDQDNITYCIADSWGAQKPRAIADMREAVSQWMAAADVTFEYVPSEDDSCGETNVGVLVNVLPWNGGGVGCYPYACRYLKMNYGADFGNYTWLGAWTHEVGHVLGLAHEHIRGECEVPDSPPLAVRTLTAYDSRSAMHYDTVCGSTSLGQMTGLDRQGLASLYGAPASTAFAVTPAAWVLAVI
jgi:hypothetical protein